MGVKGQADEQAGQQAQGQAGQQGHAAEQAGQQGHAGEQVVQQGHAGEHAYAMNGMNNMAGDAAPPMDWEGRAVYLCVIYGKVTFRK